MLQVMIMYSLITLIFRFTVRVDITHTIIDIMRGKEVGI